jgi:hypothetical protein
LAALATSRILFPMAWAAGVGEGSVNPPRKWRTIAWDFLLMVRPD